MSPKPKRRRQLPGGVLGALALVLAVELYVHKHDRDYTTVWASSWSRSGRAARGEAVGCDVLCLGDSLIKHGILPRVIEARTGRSALNLAVFNGQAPTTYFLLRRALDAGAKPSAVLLDGELLEVDPRIHARLWADLLEPAECLELARAADDWSFFGQIMAAHALPTLKDRYEIRADLLAALGGRLNVQRLDLAANWRNWQANRGAHIMPTAAPPAELVASLAATNYWPTGWQPHSLNAKYVKQTLRLAQRAGVPVYWLMPPVHPEVADRRERAGRDADYLRFIRSLQSQFPDLLVVDGRHARYDPTAMHDLTHLNRLGATTFSAEIAAILARGDHARGVRWVELPPFQGRPGDVPVEDLAESRTALRDEWAARHRRR